MTILSAVIFFCFLFGYDCIVFFSITNKALSPKKKLHIIYEDEGREKK
jgi:hypothetical protein